MSGSLGADLTLAMPQRATKQLIMQCGFACNASPAEQVFRFFLYEFEAI